MSDVTTSSNDRDLAPLGIGARLVMAFILPWKIFFDGRLAARVQLAEAATTPELPPGPSDDDKAKLKALNDANDAAQAALAESKADVAAAKASEEKVAAELKEATSTLKEHQARLEKRNDPDGALHLLRIFQRDGRLIDFLREDIAGFGDADIGGAARLVHEGCRKSIDDYFVFERVSGVDEGAAITIDAGFNAEEIRLTGNVSGDGPYKGTLAHGGWKVSSTKLPTLPEEHDPAIVAPAEVEL